MFGGTERQHSYLKTLISERAYNGELTIEQHLNASVPGGSVSVLAAINSVEQASQLIEQLSSKPRISFSAQTSNRISSAKAALIADVPIGVHKVEGTIYRVQASRQDGSRLYAKKLILAEAVSTGEPAEISWEYDGQRNFSKLSKVTLLSLDEAKKFGLAYGVCVACGRTLTDQKSIEAGIGPVCAEKMQ